METTKFPQSPSVLHGQKPDLLRSPVSTGLSPAPGPSPGLLVLLIQIVLVLLLVLVRFSAVRLRPSELFLKTKRRRKRCDRLNRDQLLLLFIITAPPNCPRPCRWRKQTRAASQSHLLPVLTRFRRSGSSKGWVSTETQKSENKAKNEEFSIFQSENWFWFLVLG